MSILRRILILVAKAAKLIALMALVKCFGAAGAELIRANAVTAQLRLQSMARCAKSVFSAAGTQLRHHKGELT